jgi:D-alanine-D-alanine ligase
MKKKVMILMGGISEEHYLSLRSGENIFNHIDRNKYNVSCVKWEKNGSLTEFENNSLTDVKQQYNSITDFLSNLKQTILFNVLHGNLEGDGRLTALFEFFNILYTGNGYYTSVTGMNKYLSKLIFAYNNIQTPDFILVNEKNMANIKKMEFPLIIKPVFSGSSIGMKKVNYLKEAQQWIEKLWEENHTMIIAERFIPGNDYSVAVLSDLSSGCEKKVVFNVARIDYNGELFDDACKYNNEYTTVVPSGLSNEKECRLKEIALKLHDIFGFRGISRTDFIINKESVYVLEVNTHPGLSEHSIVPSMITQSGYSMEEIIEILIDNCIVSVKSLYN